MALTLYEWIYGVTQFAVAFLSLNAIVVSIILMRVAWKQERLTPWRFLLIALILFAIEEILGTLVTFGIINPTFWTHVVPSFIMVFLIAALLSQLYFNRLYKARKPQVQKKKSTKRKR